MFDSEEKCLHLRFETHNQVEINPLARKLETGEVFRYFLEVVNVHCSDCGLEFEFPPTRIPIYPKEKKTNIPGRWNA